MLGLPYYPVGILAFNSYRITLGFLFFFVFVGLDSA